MVLRYEPIFKFFISVSHKIFNEIVIQNAGNCGNLIVISVDSDISNVSFQR
jgi:hypothetical protein